MCPPSLYHSRTLHSFMMLAPPLAASAGCQRGSWAWDHVDNDGDDDDDDDDDD
jgi:hypothetical protein